MHKNLLKLCRQLIKLASIETENATLFYEGDIEVGTEVFIEDETGELVPAPDGTYDKYVVVEGKVSEIKEEEIVEEKVEQAEEEEIVEPEVDEEKEALKAKIAEQKAIIAELEAKIAELENKQVEEEFNSLKPASKEIKDFNVSEKGAMKYFKY